MPSGMMVLTTSTERRRASFDVLGENVACNYGTASGVMRGWLTSAGHRANIVSAKFRRIGVGCVIDADGRRWWTQDFEG